MEILLLIIIGIAAIKILTFYLTTKIKAGPKRALAAEEVIKCKGYRPEQYKKIMDNTIIDYTRNKKVEEEYKELRDLFKYKLQHKEINRGQLIGIEEYLRQQLKNNKEYKNNAHAIYSMLKMPNLTLNHISTISNFIK